MNQRLAAAITAEAQRIGADPEDLATAISYETGGTFDPWKEGPTTKWGTHRGLIQMGEEQRAKYGYTEGMEIEDAVRASADYLVDSGFKPGMSGLDLYSTINAGAPGRYDASDTTAGGAPGSVKDKWERQMDGHRKNAQALLGGVKGGVPINAGAYVGITAPRGPDAFQIAENAVKPYDSFGDELAANWPSTVTAQIIRYASEGAVDPDFSIPDERALQLLEDIPENYHDLILDASSEENLQNRLHYVREEVERRKHLSAGGASAVAAGLMVGMADPVPLVASVATGGIGMVGRGSLAARAAIGAVAGGATNATIDLSSQAALDDPYADPVIAGAVGAAFGAVGGVLARNKAAKDIAAEAYDTGLTFSVRARDARNKAAADIDPTLPRIDPPKGSVGAARNTEARDSLLPAERAALGEVADEDVPVAVGGALRLDVIGQMTTSKNPLTRLIGMYLGEEPAGFKGHEVVPDSVNSVFTAIYRETTGQFNMGYQKAKAGWLKEAGVSRLRLIERSKLEAEFNRQVVAYVRNPSPPPDVNPHIVKAAEVFRKTMDDVRRAMNAAGVTDLDANPHYTPLIPQHDRIAKIDRLVHQDTMTEFFTQAIRNRLPDFDPAIIKRMARGYWDTIRKVGYGMQDAFTHHLQLGDREGFKDAFRASLETKGALTDAQMDAAFDALSGLVDGIKKAAPGDTPAAGRFFKRRTLMDYDFKASVPLRNDPRARMALSVYDLFEDDAEFLMGRYLRTTSGRRAFANLRIENPSNGKLLVDGIRSEADVRALQNQVRESYRLGDGSYGVGTKEMERQVKNIDFMWKRIAGIPVWDNSSEINQWARRLKTMQFIRLMSNMGLNQFQEGWKIMSLTGFRAAMSQFPAIRTMMDGVNAGKWDKDKLLTELTDMTGLGLDALWNKFNARLHDDRIGAGMGSRFDQRVDAALDLGQQFVSHISLMRTIMDYQQRWAMKAITQQMVHMARKALKEGDFDLSKIKLRDRQRLASMGLGDDDAKLLFRNLMEHSEFNGNKVVGVNPDAWDPEAVSKFRLFVGRYTDRLVQQNDFGALNRWLSQPVASMFVQFRSFVFGAFGKSTLWSLNHMDPKMAVMVLGEIAMGTATFAVSKSHMLTTVEGREKWREEMTAVNLLKNGWARTATASVLPMFLDSALMHTSIGPQFGSARASGTPLAAWVGSPVGDQYEAAKRLILSVQEMGTVGGELSQRMVRDGVRMLPVPGNFLPFTAMLAPLIEDLPEK